MTRTSLRLPGLIVLGTFLMQAAWILALPPFAGVDEFDHAYRASAVAHGEVWSSDVPAADGRGELVVVSRDIVEAAGEQCRAKNYTGPDNCRPVDDAGNGLVTVASAAASYHPAFYWVMGTAAEPFNGATALYAMRIVSALLCSLFLGLAAWAISAWAKTRWPVVGLLVAVTPVTMYSASIAAPNGIEMCASVALWMSLLGLSQPGLPRRTQRMLLLAALPSAIVVTTVRSLGPVWLLLIVLTTAALMGTAAVRRIIKQHRMTLLAVVSAVVVATVLSAWWIVTQTPNAREGVGHFSHPLLNSLIRIPLWFFQSIAAFPSRTEQAPLPVYLAAMAVFFPLLALALMAGSRRHRAAIISIALISLIVPVAASTAIYGTDGAVWQGRYGLPYAFGLVFLAGLALETARFDHRYLDRAIAGGWALLSLAQVISVTSVLVKQANRAPSSTDSQWVFHPTWLIVGLAVLGCAVWALALRRTSDPLHDPAQRLTINDASVTREPSRVAS